MRLIGRAQRTVHATAGGPTRRRRGGLVGLVVTSLLAQAVIASAIIPAVSAADAACGARPLDVEIVIDRSLSMGNTDTATGTPPQTRIVYAKQAATGLVNDLDANGGVGGSDRHMVGVTRYGNDSASVVAALSAGSSAATVNAAINGLTTSGNTPLKQGMATGAADMLAGDRATDDGLDVHQVIIFLSDGKPYPDPANRPSGAEINAFKGAADEIFSVAIGEGGDGAFSVDVALMQALAKPLDAAHSFHVVDASDLPDIFDQIFAVIACTPDIEVVKTASVTSLPAGGGDVTYTYDVSNAGNVPLSDVEVADDKCAPVTYVGGDANTDDLLDLTETWQFTCTANLTATTTNVVTATGTFEDETVDDTDDETVTVAEPTPEPTPVVTPEPTPVVTPEPTPVVTPEPTPVVTPEPTPVVTPEPTPVVTPKPTPGPTGMMVILKLDDMGTEDDVDDLFLEGAWFEIYRDDGDSIFEDGEDTLVATEAEAWGGFLETKQFAAGAYWIVESTVPDGYVGHDPILIALNVDPNLVCFWDLGVKECEEAFEPDGVAYTAIIITNTPTGGPTPTSSVAPTATPTGEVGGATGTPRLTLPPTDVVDSSTTTSTSPISFLVIMAILGGLAAIAVIATPATARRRNRSDR